MQECVSFLLQCKISGEEEVEPDAGNAYLTGSMV